MHILWLKSDLLLPLDKGGRLRTWHLLRHLARRHEITYVAFAEPDAPATLIDGMREVAARVVTVPRTQPAKGSWRFYADAAAHLLDPVPYAVAAYRSRAYRRAVENLLSPVDLLVCDFLVPAVNLSAALPCPSVLFTHNVEADIWRRHRDTARGPIARTLYRTQYQRMLRFEERTLSRFDTVLAVSDADRRTFDRLYPGALRRPAVVIPTGVDTEYFAPAGPSSDDPELVFTGSMDWLPNEDAMRYFCEAILPRIRAAEPRARLTIVGRAPTPAVRRLAEIAGVDVTGGVPDVRPYLARAAACIVPLRIGGGTRLKIFEAMAMGKAVVSTTVGAEGLPIVWGEHAAIADDPDGFSRAVLRVLRDRAYRRRLEEAGRALVTSQYDWSAAAARLDEALRTTLAARRVPDARPSLAGSLSRAQSRDVPAAGEP
jgi:sugar transferase (PEP-CTERM/EpsH1 system associated)